MKNFLLILTISLLSITAFAQAPDTANTNILETINIQKELSAQLFRNGRELYLKGSFKEAADVFKHALKIHCSDPLAQYHLQKIANKGAAFKDAQDFLNALPCPKQDFSNKDLVLPSLYYESDAGRLLADLVTYQDNKHAVQSSLTQEIATYKKTAADLEATVKELTAQLATANNKADLAQQETAKLQAAQQHATELEAANKKEAAELMTANKEAAKLAAKNKKSAAKLETIQQQIKAAQITTKKAVTKVKRLTRRKQRRDLRIQKKQLAKIRLRLDSEMYLREKAAEEAARPYADPIFTVGQDIIAGEEKSMQQTDELETLQQKFTNIQERLGTIAQTISSNNAAINGLSNELPAAK